MSDASDSTQAPPGKLRWIAFGFVGAFAASIFTVIYTGLNVEESSSGDFDAGFRSVTLAVGEQRSIELVFELERAVARATLEVTLPSPVELAGGEPGRTILMRPVTVSAGQNSLAVDVRAKTPGSGYLVARLVDDDRAGESVGLYRVFVTVESGG